MKRIRCVVLLVAAMAIAASAQENPVHWSATYPARVAHRGQKFTAKVSARIDPGWHIYSITQAPGGPTPTSITVLGGQPFSLDGFVIGPLPHSSYDSNFQMETDTYAESASFKVPVTVDAKAPLGANAVAIDVRFEVCNDRSCLPATTVHLKTPVRITAAGTSAVHKTADGRDEISPIGKAMNAPALADFSSNTETRKSCE